MPTNDSPRDEAVGGDGERKEALPTGPALPSESQRQMTVQAVFSGPLPPPGLLKAYNEVEPGLAARIMEMAEAEARHRRDLERAESAAAIQVALQETQLKAEDLRSDYLEAHRGQVFAALIGGLALGCSTYLGIHGAQTTACILGGGGLVAIVTAFLRGRRTAEPPQPERAPSLTESD